MRNSPTTRKKQPAQTSNEGDSFLKKLVERLTGKKLPPESQLFDETSENDDTTPTKDADWKDSKVDNSVRKGFVELCLVKSLITLF